MAQVCIDTRAVAWPAAPVDAAHLFYSEIAPQVRRALGGDPAAEAVEAIVVVFPPAQGVPEQWRLAAMQALAVEAAPGRVNGIVGEDDEPITATIAWLAGAPGITGQLLEMGGKTGAGE